MSNQAGLVVFFLVISLVIAAGVATAIYLTPESPQFSVPVTQGAQQQIPAPVPSPSAEAVARVETTEDPDDELHDNHFKGEWSKVPWVTIDNRQFTLDYTRIRGFKADYNDFGASCLCIGVVWAPRPNSGTFGIMNQDQYDRYMVRHRTNKSGESLAKGVYGTNEYAGVWRVPSLTGTGTIAVPTVVFEKPAKDGCPKRTFALRGPLEKCNKVHL